MHIASDNCTGCGVCSLVCPNGAISLIYDKEGFLYPSINVQNCVDCHLCRKHCHLKRTRVSPALFQAFVGWHSDERIRRLSTSGGAFTALAELTAENDGITVGAAYDINAKEVVHKSTDQCGLSDLRRSKYVQSRVDIVFPEIKRLLDDNQWVLFCGTPCQVQGLKAFVGEDKKTLITCDFICHGAASTALFREHLNALEKTYHSKVKRIEFRYKIGKWSEFILFIVFESGKKYARQYNHDAYYYGFMNNLFLRPCCYDCTYSENQHNSDLTIADYWGVNRQYPNDEKGISLIIANTQRGLEVLRHLQATMTLHPLSPSKASYVYGQHTYDKAKRQAFFSCYIKHGYKYAVKRHVFNLSTSTRIKQFIRIIINQRKYDKIELDDC